MIQTGAKGSTVNASQISCLLGQMALEGKRVPVMVSGKTLPSFRPFDTSARAGGFILDRYLTGIKPQEYFFHCMAGREGLVDTAVKTSRSGYLQRCLIKHMEDLKVNYDLTVRDADGSVVQFLYGEDGLDVSKTAMLQNFNFMTENYRAILDKFGAKAIPHLFSGKFLKKGPKTVKKAREKPHKYPPPLSELRPDRYFGAVSEKYQEAIETYIAGAADGEGVVHRGASITVDGPKLQQLAHLKSLKSLVSPGEAVGVLAAQAIGEPSTQMTLNTFHFAGRSEMNVTLGIPRLREVLMTASRSIKTPIITGNLKPGPKAQKQAIKLSSQLRKVTLKDVLQACSVTHHLTRQQGGLRNRMYQVRIQLIGAADVKKNFGIRLTGGKGSVMDRIESFLSMQLPEIVRKEQTDIGVGKVAKVSKADEEEADEAAKKAAAPDISLSDSDDEDSENDDPNAEDNGTLASSARSKRAQGGAYGKDSDMEESGDEEDGLDDGSGSSDDDSDDEADPDDVPEKGAGGVADVSERERRRSEVVSGNECVADYTYNDKEGWCTVTYRYSSKKDTILYTSLIERTAETVIIRAVKGINGCMLLKPKPGAGGDGGVFDRMQVDGEAIREMWRRGTCLNVNSIRTNNIHTMLDTYGVEAARATIVNEVNAVFAVYGIEVDARHMSLVADTMTQGGGYCAMNRMGLRPNASPLLKMSFETTFEFLRNATVSGDYDPMDSASSRIVLGQPALGGTGSFDLRCSLVPEL
jgi:DNA-directed RNA polymerase I subunit RPA1